VGFSVSSERNVMNAQVNRLAEVGSFLPLAATEEFEIKVPASIANLGPGFETLAVAVQLYATLRVKKMPGNGGLQFSSVDGGGGREKAIERAYRYLAGEKVGQLPSLSVEVSNEIPLQGGLGGRAAATVAGLRLYDSVAGVLSVQELLQAACALGCNPDNAAASLLGGLTLSCRLPDESVYATRFPWPEALGLVVLTPSGPPSGARPRAELPDSISRADVVFNLQRVALLLQILRSGDFALLKHALEDRVHQPSRQERVPGLSEAFELRHPDLLGICLSGSGPSIVALAERNLREIGKMLTDVYQRAGIACQMRVLDVHQERSAYSKIFRSGLLCCS
jgi:homoserine kinase